MGYQSNRPNPIMLQCLEEIKPLIDAIFVAVKTSPLDAKDQAGLAVMIAANFTGYAGAAAAQASSEVGRMERGEQIQYVTDLITAVAQGGGHG